VLSFLKVAACEVACSIGLYAWKVRVQGGRGARALCMSQLFPFLTLCCIAQWTTTAYTTWFPTPSSFAWDVPQGGFQWGMQGGILQGKHTIASAVFVWRVMGLKLQAGSGLRVNSYSWTRIKSACVLCEGLGVAASWCILTWRRAT
jgi:hypothetical protein